MATKWTYPPDDELDALIRQAGVTHTAEQLGMPRSTLEHHIYDRRRAGFAMASKRDPRAPVATDGIDVPVSREEILEQRVAELERERRRRRQTDVRDERIIAAFQQATESVTARYKPPRRPSRQGDGDHEHILLLSDLHAGEVVSEEETLGMNAYNWDTMLQRLMRVQDAVLSFQENRPYPINKLHVAMLGDMLSGDIHPELSDTNEWPIAECAVQLGIDVSEWLERFVPAYNAIEVTGVVGNHPRLSIKPRAKNAAVTNVDWLFYKYVEAYHRLNPALTFNFPNAKFADVMVGQRWRTLLLHGDGIRSSMVDVPFGGIIRYSQKLEAQFHRAGRPLDYIFCGHWHTQNAIEGIGTKLFVNGSVKGMDEYALQRFGSARPPGQLLLTVHPRRGVTDVSYLDCVDQHPNAEAVQRRAAA